MVSTRERKLQNERQLSQFNETLNDVIIGNNNKAGVTGNETWEHQTSGLISILEDTQLVKTVQVKTKSLKGMLTTKLERKWIMLSRLSEIECVTHFSQR